MLKLTEGWTTTTKKCQKIQMSIKSYRNVERAWLLSVMRLPWWLFVYFPSHWIRDPHMIILINTEKLLRVFILLNLFFSFLIHSVYFLFFLTYFIFLTFFDCNFSFFSLFTILSLSHFLFAPKCKLFYVYNTEYTTHISNLNAFYIFTMLLFRLNDVSLASELLLRASVYVRL